jgi:hypothetical protein
MISDWTKAIAGGCICGVLGCGAGGCTGAYFVGQLRGDLDMGIAASIAGAVLGGLLGAFIGAFFFGSPSGGSTREKKP